MELHPLHIYIPVVVAMVITGVNCPAHAGTIEYEAQLRHENEMKRLQAEMKERGRMERENHDLNLEKIKVKAAEDRVTVLESVK